MSEPIFEQLRAEFMEQSKFVGLRIGPLVGEDFEQVEVTDEHFGTIGHITRMIPVEIEEPELGFVESIVQDIEEAKPEFLPMTDSAKNVPQLELNLMKFHKAPEPKKLYIVEGAPELVKLDEVHTEEPSEKVGDEPTDMEKTLTFPVVKEELPKPPSVVAKADVDQTQILPVIPTDDEVNEKNYTDTFFDPKLVEPEEKQHVTPIKRSKIHHKKNSATGLLPRITGRAA